jgi:hypothetical protein
MLFNKKTLTYKKFSMKNLYFGLCLLFCQISIANAQTPPPSHAINSTLMTGTIGIAYHKDYGFINLGGPTVRIGNKTWGLSLSMLPSLMYKWKENTDQTATLGPTPQLIPNLGASVGINYKRATVIAPFYYILNRRIFVTAVGIGYRFGK